MALPFDAALKSIVAEHPGDFALLFGLPTNQPVVPLNVDLSTISAATDVVLAYGKPIHEIVDLNFQSGSDPRLPRRLHLYNAALNHRHEVPVHSILVLLRKAADGQNLTGNLTYGEGRKRVEFNYNIVRLWEHAAEEFLRAKLSLIPFATLGELPVDKPMTEALREIALAIAHRLNVEAAPAKAAKLLTAAYTLTGMRVKKPELATIFGGLGIMAAETAWDEAIETGELRGEIRGQIQVLLRLARKQFGAPDATTEAELKSIRDLDRLERLADAILTAKSWQELLATP